MLSEAVHSCLACGHVVKLPVAVRGFVAHGHERRGKKRKLADKSATVRRQIVAAAAGSAATAKDRMAAAMVKQLPPKKPALAAPVSASKKPSLLAQFLQSL